ncbi:glycosyltransferase family 4 protein [Psychromonas sp. MB-3u-54]|uniref:glycosyltransferase family 4 protein n=1 Tax=Psychromonas sp. MB-3u-54 TaxID=2058319 RepID=UPI0018E34793|nr:glycosyltransferase family 4 protein [Psychromonas sp. MB-3u-54]
MSKKTKLLFVFEHWGDGGTEKYAETLGHDLNKRPDISIHIVLFKDLEDDVPQLEWAESVSVVKGNRLARCFALRRLVKSIKPDICHFHLYTSLLLVTIALVGIKRLKTVATFHSPISIWNRIYRAAFFLSTRLLDKVIAGSELTAHELRDWRKDVQTCPPPINIPAIPHFLGKEKNIFVISGCGRLSREKDWSTLIEAMAWITENAEEEIRCEIIGEGFYRERLETLIDKHNLQEKVVLKGRLEHADALTCVASSDLFVLPSLFEGFGMAAVEAMTLGVPTITADFPAATEYIKEGETGQSFPRGNAEALAKLILQHIDDVDFSQKIGKRGRTSVLERYSTKIIAEKHIEIYHSLLGNNPDKIILDANESIKG